MISDKDALSDLEKIEQLAPDSGSKAIIKALQVVVKFLSTMRSNQLLTDEEKVKIKRDREEKLKSK
jgi:hypothetical protein